MYRPGSAPKVPRMESGSAAAMDEIAEMAAELEAAPAIYRPSRFWQRLNEINVRMLAEAGLTDFKRTVAQNYFNWLVLQKEDPQFQTLLRYWRSHPTLRPLLNRMERPTDVQTTEAATNFSRGRDFFIYKIFVGLLWEYMLAHDRTGLGRRLEEPLEGNPIRIRRRGRRISQDLANSILELNLLVEHFGSGGASKRDFASARIAELGAGYGRVAHVTTEYAPGSSYFIVDIPPALLVSQHYLSSLYPDDRMFRFRRFERFEDVREELEQSRIAFLTPNQLDLLPDGYFDACLTISTLPEMSRDQADHYVSLLSRKSGHLLYLKQWISWKNTFDDVCVAREDYALGPGWKLAYNEIDSVQPAFFNALWTRSG